MSGQRWKKKPQKVAKAKLRSVGWASAKPVNARDANSKLRAVRLQQEAAEAELPRIVARPVPRRRPNDPQPEAES